MHVNIVQSFLFTVSHHAARTSRSRFRLWLWWARPSASCQLAKTTSPSHRFNELKLVYSPVYSSESLADACLYRYTWHKKQGSKNAWFKIQVATPCDCCDCWLLRKACAVRHIPGSCSSPTYWHIINAWLLGCTCLEPRNAVKARAHVVLGLKMASALGGTLSWRASSRAALNSIQASSSKYAASRSATSPTLEILPIRDSTTSAVLTGL